MLKNLLPIIVFICYFSLTLSAQIEVKGTPKSLLSTSTLTDQVPVEVMPTDEIDMPRLLAEDDADLQDGLPLRYAHRFYKNYNLNNSGQWETLANGDRVWRLTIHSPGAMGLNLGYSDFFMPEGATFFVYNAYDTSDRIGAFTSKNNKPHRQFVTRLINDDKVTLEYYEPLAVRNQGAIEVAIIGHAYRNMDGQTMAERSGNCQVSINCSEGADWQDEKKGVARISIDLAFLCSGTLIANTSGDQTPYFSTANHCIASTAHDAVANPLIPLWTFYWNYECLVGSCDTSEPGDDCTRPEDETTVGGTIVASSGGPGQAVNLATEFGDFALIELGESPVDAGYDVFFNGWDKRGPENTYRPDECIGIHHPAGDVKKISTDIDGADVESTGQYWELFWEVTANGHSVTEGGSSGSPLFDKISGRVIGQLLGGGSVNCDDPANDRALYGGFFYSFTNPDNPQAILLDARKLEPWLDPQGTGDLFVDGYYPDGSTGELPVPKIAFTTPTSNVIEEAEVADTEGCRPYKDYAINIFITKVASEAVTLNIQADTENSAADEMDDFELMTNTVTLGLDDNNLSADVILRVYDDAALENLENVFLTYSINQPYTGDAIPNTANQTHNLLLADNDFAPEDAASQTVTVFQDNFDDITTTWTPSNGLVHSWVVASSETETDAIGMTNNCTYVSFDVTGGYVYNENLTPDNLSILSEAIDATGLTDLEVTFDWATTGEVSYDFGEFVYSTDGSTLQSFPDAVILVDKGDAVTADVKLPTSLNNSTFHIGFRWQHDEIAGDPQPLAFDNVKLVGIQGGAAPVAQDMGGTMTAPLAPMSTVYFYDEAGNIMLSLSNLDETHDFGCTTVTIDRAGTGNTAAWEAGKDMLDKTFSIEVDNNLVGKEYEVTLYYTDAEIAGWAGNQAGDDVSALKMIKTTSAIADGTASNYISSLVTVGTYGSNHTYSATFNTGFSGFGLGNVSESALAVELLDFNAKSLENSILLQWSTQSEVNHKGFEIQRSTQLNDGFETIAWTDAKGNNGADYTYEDTSVKAGTVYYYRLNQIDFSTKSAYSNIVSAEITSILTTQVMPNPVHDQLNISLSTKQALQGQLQLIDLLGRKVWTQPFLTEDALNMTIPMAHLTNGVYFLQVIANGEIIQIDKIIKE